MPDLVTRAFNYANAKHAGQMRNCGVEPYIFHPVRVASAVEGDIAKAVALLHDVVEDCFPRTLEGVDQGLFALRHEGFPDAVVEAVDAMTQRKFDGERSRTGEQYFDYIRRIARNDLAKLVKLADIADNSHTLPDGDSLLMRYAKAKWILHGERKKR